MFHISCKAVIVPPPGVLMSNSSSTAQRNCLWHRYYLNIHCKVSASRFGSCRLSSSQSRSRHRRIRKQLLLPGTPGARQTSWAQRTTHCTKTTRSSSGRHLSIQTRSTGLPMHPCQHKTAGLTRTRALPRGPALSSASPAVETIAWSSPELCQGPAPQVRQALEVTCSSMPAG